MEETNYTLMSSLEHTALIRIAVTLWNQDNIRALIAKFYFPDFTFGSARLEKWQEVEYQVIRKVPELSQPELLENKIFAFIKPIGFQILNWVDYHNKNLYLPLDLPNELYWTPQGTVDKKKTAEVLIKDDNLSITSRYKLACNYCLENDIAELWNKMSENDRIYFYSEEDPRKVKEQELVVFWTYDIKGEVDKLGNMIESRLQRRCSPYQYAFEYAAVDANIAATEYFLQKLTSREREQSLVRSAGYVINRNSYFAPKCTDFPIEHYAEVLCFLFSQMDKDQQIEVFKSYHYEVLKYLLDWPWQNIFMETANRMWEFLSEEYYEFLLRRIVKKVVDGYKDCNYQKLFEEFWKQSPNIHKRYVVNEWTRGSLFAELLKIVDKDTVKLILKDAPLDATLIARKKIIYGAKWHLLKFFAQECILFKEIMINRDDNTAQ